MFFVQAQTKQKYEVKKSVFISYLVPMSEFKTLLESLKKQHPKATHIIWAYRYLNDFNQIVENSTDDGEPKGSAGPTTLSVMRGEDLIESAILTVRYFGGTKLGVGGIIRAYIASAKEVIKLTDFITYEKRILYEFNTPYSIVGKYEHFLNNENTDFKDRKFGATKVSWRLSLTKEEILKIEEFKQNL